MTAIRLKIYYFWLGYIATDSLFYQAFRIKKEKRKLLKKMKSFWRQNAEENAALKPLAANHFKNLPSSEYEFFEKSPTICLPKTSKEMPHQPIPFSPDKKQASARILTPFEIVRISPEYVKFNERLKKKSRFLPMVEKEETLKKKQNSVDSSKPAAVLPTTIINNEASPKTNSCNVPEKVSSLLSFSKFCGLDMLHFFPLITRKLVVYIDKFWCLDWLGTCKYC